MMSYNQNLFFRIQRILFNLRKHNFTFKKSFIYLFLFLSLPFSYLLFKQGPRLINKAVTPPVVYTQSFEQAGKTQVSLPKLPDGSCPVKPSVLGLTAALPIRPVEPTDPLLPTISVSLPTKTPTPTTPPPAGGPTCPSGNISTGFTRVGETASYQYFDVTSKKNHSTNGSNSQMVEAQNTGTGITAAFENLDSNKTYTLTIFTYVEKGGVNISANDTQRTNSISSSWLPVFFTVNNQSKVNLKITSSEANSRFYVDDIELTATVQASITPSNIDRYRNFSSRQSKTSVDYFGKDLNAQGEGDDNWYDHGFGNGRIKYKPYALIPKDYLKRRRGSTLSDAEIATRLTPSIQNIVNGYRNNLQIELQVEPIQVRYLPNTLEEIVCGTDAWCENPDWNAYITYVGNFSGSNLTGPDREFSVNTLLVFGGAGIAFDSWQSHIFVGDWGFSSLFDYHWSDCGANCDVSGFEYTLAHEMGHSLGFGWHPPSFAGPSIMGGTRYIILADHEGYPERYLACLTSLNHGSKNCDQFQKPNRPFIYITRITGQIMTACNRYKTSTLVAFSKNPGGGGNRTVESTSNLNSDGTFAINANITTRAWERGYGINLFLNNIVVPRDFNDLEQVWQHTDKAGHYHFISSGKLCADDFEYCVDDYQFMVQPRSVQPSTLCEIDLTSTPPPTITPTPTRIPTQTPTPTQPPIVTSTPRSTPTPIPTRTPAPVLTGSVRVSPNTGTSTLRCPFTLTMQKTGIPNLRIVFQNTINNQQQPETEWCGPNTATNLTRATCDGWSNNLNLTIPARNPATKRTFKLYSGNDRLVAGGNAGATISCQLAEGACLGDVSNVKLSFDQNLISAPGGSIRLFWNRKNTANGLFDIEKYVNNIKVETFDFSTSSLGTQLTMEDRNIPQNSNIRYKIYPSNSQNKVFDSCLSASSVHYSPQIVVDYMQGGNECRIKGWARDQDIPNTPVTVEVYMDQRPLNGRKIATSQASIFDLGLKNVFRSNGNHRFDITLGPEIRDNRDHTLYITARNISGTLGTFTNAWRSQSATDYYKLRCSN